MSDFDIIKEFVFESSESLDRFECNLLELERHPAERELLADIFRTIHTMKGAAGFLGFAKLETVAHAAEPLLAALWDGQFHLTPDIMIVLRVMVAAIRRMLQTIDADRTDGAEDYKDLIAQLLFLQASRS